MSKPTAPSGLSAGAGPSILHELPGRLRVGLPALRDPDVSRVALEQRLGSLPGVRAARANRRAGCVVVEHDGRPATRRGVLSEIEAWHRAPEVDSLPDPDDGPDGVELAASGLLALATPLLPPRLRSVATAANIAPAVFRGASTLITQGLKVPVMDAAALLMLTLGRGDHQAANTTAFLLRLAEYLEHRTERRSEDLLKRLLAPVPGTAWVEVDGELQARPAGELASGDVLVVGPGEMILADGRVHSGAATVNESVMTGESLPVGLEPGDAVRAGTTVIEGRIHVHAERVGRETGLSRISSYIEEALRNPAPTQRLATEMADRRLGYTLALASGVFLWTGSVDRLASMLLVDFSCALKIGVPVAFRTAMKHSAEAGAVPKGAAAVESLGRADTFVFDKTGTLTTGNLSLSGVHTLDPRDWPEDRFLAVMASLEEHAQHPIARSIVDLSSFRNLDHVSHTPVEFVVAHGLRAEVEGRAVVLGNRHFLEAHEGVDFAAVEDRIAPLEAEGKLLVFMACDARLVGFLAFEDAVRKETREVLKGLRAAGVQRLVMLTGDRRGPAEALGARLGMDQVIAEVEPEGKAQVVSDLQKRGYRVAFIGDGVNDGPALAQAHVGIAMPKGTDLARATADMLLLREDLRTLLQARKIAHATLERLQNHFRVAMTANTAIMGAAGLGLLTPMASATLHNGTTLALLAESLMGASVET
ncbi:heavy metal translocating P-type ATPase [Geothrix sp. 21YS21S-4]|uniref:heavy metal translocating P-type ATPase n=1 Tax=Geothrix sp. 21YS21S-4 TaxID=3068889 RepID=UPI0027B971D1|nr:heavy metal translocating P-type ATPase [Geothrix sp. 21YS21S-4]